MNGEKALEILKRPFHSGTLVINCVVHTRLDWHDRPRTCDLCWADMATISPTAAASTTSSTRGKKRRSKPSRRSELE